MKKFLYIALAVILIYVVQRRYVEDRVAKIDAATLSANITSAERPPLFGENDPCAGKKSCMTVYISLDIPGSLESIDRKSVV